MCLQETKRQSFDLQFIRKFCPQNFDSFHFLPSTGASGGILVVWQGNLFKVDLAFQNEFAVSINFTSKLNEANWILQQFMPLAPTKEKEISPTGSKTFNCLMTWIGLWLEISISSEDLKTETRRELMSGRCFYSMRPSVFLIWWKSPC